VARLVWHRDELGNDLQGALAWSLSVFLCPWTVYYPVELRCWMGHNTVEENQDMLSIGLVVGNRGRVSCGA